MTVEALRPAREDGTILCCTYTSPLLKNIFKLFFEERKEFALHPTQKVLQANAKDACWRIEGVPRINAEKTAE